MGGLEGCFPLVSAAAADSNEPDAIKVHPSRKLQFIKVLFN